MASIFFATRGIMQQVELWEKFMQTQTYSWQRRNLSTNRIEPSVLQGALRPIQFWEYVVPKAAIPDVLTNMKIAEYEGFPEPEPGKEKSTPAVTQNPVNPNLSHLNKYTFLLRKALKLKPIPKIVLTPGMGITRLGMYTDGVSILPIGYKDDKVDANEVIGYEQEMV